jgi:hypothetical protein
MVIPKGSLSYCYIFHPLLVGPIQNLLTNCKTRSPLPFAPSFGLDQLWSIEKVVTRSIDLRYTDKYESIKEYIDSTTAVVKSPAPNTRI